MKTARSIFFATICLCLLSGCQPHDDSFALKIRVQALETQVDALERANHDLAQASMQNSESIKQNSETLMRLIHIIEKQSK